METGLKIDDIEIVMSGTTAIPVPNTSIARISRVRVVEAGNRGQIWGDFRQAYSNAPATIVGSYSDRSRIFSRRQFIR